MGMNNIFDTEFNSNIRINAFGSRYYELLLEGTVILE